MYDLLRFIDSSQVREYNKDTYFTPAEWAVIVARSITTTMEEKLDALQNLTEHYEEADFGKESANVGPDRPVYHSYLPSREKVKETIRIWKETLADRSDSEGVVYAARYGYKERYWSHGIEDHQFFPDYKKAFQFLEEVRDEEREMAHFRKEEFTARSIGSHWEKGRTRTDIFLTEISAW